MRSALGDEDEDDAMNEDDAMDEDDDKDTTRTEEVDEDVGFRRKRKSKPSAQAMPIVRKTKKNLSKQQAVRQRRTSGSSQAPPQPALGPTSGHDVSQAPTQRAPGASGGGGGPQALSFGVSGATSGGGGTLAQQLLVPPNIMPPARQLQLLGATHGILPPASFSQAQAAMAQMQTAINSTPGGLESIPPAARVQFARTQGVLQAHGMGMQAAGMLNAAVAMWRQQQQHQHSGVSSPALTPQPLPPLPPQQQQQHSGVGSSAFVPVPAPPPPPLLLQQQHSGVGSPASAQQQQQPGFAGGMHVVSASGGGGVLSSSLLASASAAYAAVGVSGPTLAAQSAVASSAAALASSPLACGHATQAAHDADSTSWLSNVHASYMLFPANPQLLEQYNVAQERHASGDCVGLRENVNLARVIAQNYDAACKAARKLDATNYAAPVFALFEAGTSASSSAVASARTGTAGSADLRVAAPAFLLHDDIDDIYNSTLFPRDSREFRGHVLSGLAAIYSSLDPRRVPRQKLFQLYDDTHLPCIEKQTGFCCFMHVTHSILCRQIGGRSSLALYTLAANSVKFELAARDSPAASSPVVSSAASAPASGAPAGVTTRSAASSTSATSSSSGASGISFDASAEAYLYLPRVTRPKFSRLFSALANVRPCERDGLGATELALLFSLLNRSDAPALFLGCYNLTEIETRSAPTTGTRTFSGVVQLVSRYVDRLMRYGPPAIEFPAVGPNDDAEWSVQSSRSSKELFVARDKEHINEPFLPIHQIIFCFGDDSSLSRRSIGHFCSVQRVDLDDARIPYPHGTLKRHRSRFWWLQDSSSKEGLTLVHEDSMDDYFFARGQKVSVIPLRLPTSVTARTTTVATNFNSAINSLLAVAGLISFGPFSLSR